MACQKMLQVVSVKVLRKIFGFLLLSSGLFGIIVYQQLLHSSSQESYDPTELSPFIFRNAHVETTDADQLAEKIKVFCFVTASPKLLNRALAVNATWLRRCTRSLFVTSSPLPFENTLRLDVPDDHDHLTAKTFGTFEHLYTHSLEDYDWFLKADDDVFIIMENLRLLLSHLSPQDPSALRPNLPPLKDVRSTEKSLVKQLLDRYERQGKEGRPVLNTSDIVVVKFGLSLIQILDVDEKDQILKTNVWYQYEWRDEFLTWDPADYDNITDVRIPSDKIWIPDILLYNFADDRLKEQRNALVVTASSGDLLWMPQAILRSSCPFDTLFFPFDEQECVLKFGSWSYNGFKLDIHLIPNRTSFDLLDYIENNEWEITLNTADRYVKKYTCCPEPYPDLKFRVRLKRRVAFYTFILIMPCALLSLLTLVIFWVPPESPAKLILGMNIFLAFFVLLLLLAESTPKAAASVPLIGVYFCLNMVMITMSTVLTTFVANMFYRGVRINRAPKWLRVLMIDCFARCLCLRSQITEPDYTTSSNKKRWNTGRVGGNTKGQNPYTDINFAQVRLLDNGAEKARSAHPVPPPVVGDSGDVGGGFQQVPDDFPTPSVAPLMEEVRAIRDILEKVRDKKTKLEEKDKYHREWRVISCITDRVIFICYLLINFVGLLVIFLWQVNRDEVSSKDFMA